MDEQKKATRKKLTPEEKEQKRQERLAKKKEELEAAKERKNSLAEATKKNNSVIEKLSRELEEATWQSIRKILEANEITEANQLQAILKTVEELDADLIPKRKREKEEAAAKSENA